MIKMKYYIFLICLLLSGCLGEDYQKRIQKRKAMTVELLAQEAKFKEFFVEENEFTELSAYLFVENVGKVKRRNCDDYLYHDNGTVMRCAMVPADLGEVQEKVYREWLIKKEQCTDAGSGE